MNKYKNGKKEKTSTVIVTGDLVHSQYLSIKRELKISRVLINLLKEVEEKHLEVILQLSENIDRIDNCSDNIFAATQESTGEHIVVGELLINKKSPLVEIEGIKIKLTINESRILIELASNLNRSINFKNSKIKSEKSFGQTIYNIRKKLNLGDKIRKHGGMNAGLYYSSPAIILSCFIYSFN